MAELRYLGNADPFKTSLDDSESRIKKDQKRQMHSYI